MITEIPRQWRHECDKCGLNEMTETKDHCPYWATITVSCEERNRYYYVCDSCKNEFYDYIGNKRIE